MTIGPLDYSQISLHRKCPRKFYYIYRRGLKHKVGAAAHFSKYLIHQPLSEWWLSGGSPNIDWDTLYREFVGANEGIVDEYYTMEMAQVAFNGYVQQFGKDFLDYEVITSETSKIIPGFPPPGFLTKPDLVLLRKSDQKIFVKDFKATKGRKRLVVFDRQFLGQVMGFEAHGMSIDSAQLKNTKTNGVEVTWQRDEVEVTKDLLEEWKREMIEETMSIKDHELLDIWPKSAPDACVEYGDRFICPFMHICESGALKENIIGQSEKEEDPWKYQK